MKQTIVSILTILTTLTVFGQDISGEWNGLLNVPGKQLSIVFNIKKVDTGFKSTMDSPDQGAKDIPVTTTSFENSTLKLTIESAKIEYEGILDKDNKIVGNFKQAGHSFPMNLSREKIEKEKLIRPQEPTKPYPYYSEDVTFKNEKAGITLAGTLTLPKKEGVFPVVILISGSGPQNRDEELVGHKPFLVLSDFLTKNGIAVLRYDDRGTAQSTGNFKNSTSLDFATDALAAVNYLLTRKEINKQKIGLIGHSEGGLIAPIVATNSKNISFIVLLAGPGLPGNQLLLLQQKIIAEAAGMSDAAIQKAQEINKTAFNIIAKSKSSEQLKTDITAYMTQVSKTDPNKPAGMTEAEYIKMQTDKILTPWMVTFLTFNPAPTLEKVKCPVLALNGAKDLQVAPKENLTTIKEALLKGGNKNITIKELPNLNHLFQECKTGLPQEYATIEQTFAPIALNEILDWIKIQTK